MKLINSKGSVVLISIAFLFCPKLFSAQNPDISNNSYLGIVAIILYNLFVDKLYGGF